MARVLFSTNFGSTIATVLFVVLTTTRSWALEPGPMERAVAAERAGRYQDAINQYLEALHRRPDAQAAYKGLGNCYYDLGDSTSAVKAYDRYLLAYPSDIQVQNFRDKLRGEGQPGPTSQSLKEIKLQLKLDAIKERLRKKDWLRAGQTSGNLKTDSSEGEGSWAMALDGGWGYYLMGEWNGSMGKQSAIGGLPPSTGITSFSYSGPNNGGELGLELTYGLTESLRIGAEIEYWMLGSQWEWQQVSGTIQDLTINYDLNTLWIGPKVEWHFGIGNRVRPYVVLDAGYICLAGAGASADYNEVGSGIIDETTSTSINGSGWGARGGLGFNFGLGQHFFLSMELTGRYARIAKPHQAAAAGTSFSFYEADMPALDYSGLGVLGRLDWQF